MENKKARVEYENGYVDYLTQEEINLEMQETGWRKAEIKQIQWRF